MLIILQNDLHWSSLRIADSKQSRQHWAPTHNTGNEPLPKATSRKRSTKASIGEDIEQHDQDKPCQSPPVEEQFREDPETPEILLQRDTIPISHNQLWLKVKGTYAGLALVEAKCIDVDETQLATAQEKDPHKRTHLESHQWQSLIALHKQVYTLSNSSTQYRAAITDLYFRTVNPRTLCFLHLVSPSLWKPSVEWIGDSVFNARSTVASRNS